MATGAKDRQKAGQTVRDVKRRNRERRFYPDQQEPDKLSEMVDSPSLLELAQGKHIYPVERLQEEIIENMMLCAECSA